MESKTEKYLEEHHRITETAIGLAILNLKQGKERRALIALEDGVDKLKAITKLYQPLTYKMTSHGK